MYLIDKTVDCRDSQILNAKRYNIIVWQRRFMALCIILASISVLFFVIAILLPDWALINFTNTQFEQVQIQLGVWGEWRTVNATSEWVSHFINTPNTKLHRLTGVYLKHYYRVQAAFCVIALVLMIFTNGMAFYSLTHHRYMFKRLVAILYLFTGMCIVITIEILMNSVDEWNLEIAHKAFDSNWNYAAVRQLGLGVKIAWMVVFIYIISTVVFFFGSHKQKGSRAATAEFEIEDRPIYVGRD